MTAMQAVIAITLMTMEIEPAKPAMPVSPPHFSVKMGQSAETGEEDDPARESGA